MRLKLDENLGATAAMYFRSLGYDVETVREEGMSGESDIRIITQCKSETRCLVTLDLDFSNPLIFNPVEYCGIAVLRLPANYRWNDIASVLTILDKGLKHQSINGKLWIVQKNQIREYDSE